MSDVLKDCVFVCPMSTAFDIICLDLIVIGGMRTFAMELLILISEYSLSLSDDDDLLNDFFVLTSGLRRGLVDIDAFIDAKTSSSSTSCKNNNVRYWGG